jgi:hypothetical protein
VSQKTWDTHVIVKMVSDKYVSVIQTHLSQKTWDTHVIFITHHLYNHMCIPCLLWPHEFCITLTYLTLTIFTITCVSHVFCETWVLYYTNIFITHHIVKMVRDRYISIIQNSCVTKDMGYTCDCKDGEW